jgi:hypothetical protein
MNLNTTITSRFPALLKKSNKYTDAPVIVFSRYRNAFKLILDEGFGIADAMTFFTKRNTLITSRISSVNKNSMHVDMPAIIFSKYRNAFKLVWDEGFGS